MLMEIRIPSLKKGFKGTIGHQRNKKLNTIKKPGSQKLRVNQNFFRHYRKYKDDKFS